jgi:putative transposase
VKPTGDVFVECFTGCFRDECLNTHWFFPLDDAWSKIDVATDFDDGGSHRSPQGKATAEFVGSAEFEISQEQPKISLLVGANP